MPQHAYLQEMADIRHNGSVMTISAHLPIDMSHEKSQFPMATRTKLPPKGYGTEYSENFHWGLGEINASSWNKESSGLFDSQPMLSSRGQHPPPTHQSPLAASADPETFYSNQYPSIYRETIAPKDDRGNYKDAFAPIANKPDGRRLMHDESHPDKMYPSQWSSELADGAGLYSYPTTTGLAPEIPFNKDLMWKAHGQTGEWPTPMWKTWRQAATCPPYDGHDDQVEYSKYKVQVSL
ncbi:hypothetical protein CAPTEDRAFT_223814 [Capitella teleta]|uniref:Uncharacterized protein n=1 Tax=Capitella teleta TaxID=283909 RepID=R7UW65_CAPTE|nr:hypothetical protein CAPTEDRAFT_223814 [Capitella teleta]|eukprot:ELU10517.1 hypothetical protein CAPTEDRAFT_223814 [Capitella teleta]